MTEIPKLLNKYPTFKIIKARGLTSKASHKPLYSLDDNVKFSQVGNLSTGVFN